MSMPKSLVAEREDVALLLTMKLSQQSASMTHLVSPTGSLDDRKIKTTLLPLENKTSVRWEDLEARGIDSARNAAAHPLSEDIPENYVPLASKCENFSGNKRRSPSPPPSRASSSLPDDALVVAEKKLAKLRYLMKKQESMIHKACRIELDLLNKARLVREKRARMVGRLQLMKRKLRKLTVETANSGAKCTANESSSNFVLPPMFGKATKPQSSPNQSCFVKQRPSEPCIVDMTTDEDDESEHVVATSHSETVGA
jgi:hypothetical protein